MALKDTHAPSDAIKAEDINSIASGVIQNSHNIFELFLQNLFDGKDPHSLGLFFDGFEDETKTDLKDAGIVVDTVNKQLKLAGTTNSASAEFVRASSKNLQILDANTTGLSFTGDFTIECWVNFTQLASDVGEQMTFVSKIGGGGTAGFQMLINNPDNFIRIEFSDSGDADTVHAASSDPITRTGEWYHIAATVDVSAPSAQIYINGVAVSTVASLTNATSVGANNDKFVLSGRDNGSGVIQGFLDGKLDDVRVWDDIRTASEIQQNLGKFLTGAEANLQGNWRFAAGSLLDSTSNANNLTNENSTTFPADVPFASGVNDNVIDLEASSSQRLRISDSNQNGLDLSGDMTFEAWIKPESVTTSYTIASKWNAGGNQRAYLFSYTNTPSPGLQLALSTAGTSANDVLFVAIDFGTGTYFHVAVSFVASTSTATFYVDGVQQGSAQVGSVTAIFNSTADFIVGSEHGGVNPFDGLIDDVRVWNTPRSAANILANKDLELAGSESGLVAYYPLNNHLADFSQNSGNGLLPVNTPVFSTDVPFTDSGQGGVLSGAWESITTTFQQGMQNVRLWITRVNLTVPAITNFFSAFFVKSSGQFLFRTDGDQVGLDITGDITVECWFNFETIPSGGETYEFISKFSASGNQRGYKLEVNDIAGDIKFFWTLSSAGTTSTALTFIDNSIGAGEWHHLAGTYDTSTTTTKLYIDGIQVATSGGAPASIFNNTADFRIGAEGGGTTLAMDGKIDDVRIWSLVRTGPEILANKDKVLVGDEASLEAYYKLDNTLLDETSNGNTLSNSAGVTFVTDIPFTGSTSELNPNAVIAVTDTTLTIDDDQTSLFLDGDTIDIRDENNILRERKTLTLAPSFAAGETTLTFTPAIADAGGFLTTAVIERVNILPEVSLVAVGDAKSFQTPTFIRSELVNGEIEDEYSLDNGSPDNDFKVKLTLSRANTNVEPVGRRLGASLNK